ncbi:MAG: T9SS type A sorting domain-containing protein [Bacteroidetes bacterium]|nr:T9SS type A sorting domain-containing protein [Bacteroidota bacterium]
MKISIWILFFSLVNIASYAQPNKWLWAKDAQYGNPVYYGDYGNALCIDASGNSYLVGTYGGDSIQFGSIVLHSPFSSTTGFLVKYNGLGNVVWAKNFTGYNVFGQSIAQDNKGNLFVLGYYWGSSLQIGGLTLPVSSQSNSAFVARYDSAGNLVWAVPFSDSLRGSAIAADSFGMVYMAAEFSGTITVGGATLSSSSNSNFIAQLNSSNGSVNWVKQTSGHVWDMTTDCSTNLILTGLFYGNSMLLGNTQLYATGGNDSLHVDVFTAKYTPTGNLLWASTVGGHYNEIPASVTADTLGNVYVGGLHNDTFSFAGTNFASPLGVANSAGFVFKYNSTGVPQWGIEYGGVAGRTEITDVSIDSKNRLLVAGTFSSPTLTLSNNVTLTKSTAYKDAFMAQYHSNATLQWADKTNGQAFLCQIAADTASNVYLVGVDYATVNFGLISLYVPPANITNVFIAKYGQCPSPLSQPAAILGSTTVCNGKTVTYSTLPVSGAIKYIWSLPSGWIGSSSSNIITVQSSTVGGVISVSATSNCDTSLPKSLTVTVLPVPVASILEGGNLSVCQGNNAVLSANTSSGYTYQWMTTGGSAISGATNSTFVTTQAGSYRLIVSNGACADTSAPTMVSFLPSPHPVLAQSGLTLSTALGQGSYQWYRNAQLISGATNNIYTVTQNGNYYVRVTNSVQCAANSDTIVVVSIGLEDATDNGLKIYPQPAKHYLEIESALILHDPQILFHDEQGQKISIGVRQEGGNKWLLKLPDLVPGIYYLILTDSEQTIRKKVFVQ